MVVVKVVGDRPGGEQRTTGLRDPRRVAFVASHHVKDGECHPLDLPRIVAAAASGITTRPKERGDRGGMDEAHVGDDAIAACRARGQPARQGCFQPRSDAGGRHDDLRTRKQAPGLSDEKVLCEGGYLFQAADVARAKCHAAKATEKMARSPYRTTRAPPPAICFSTSLRVAIEVSPGVVEARAPWAAP